MRAVRSRCASLVGVGLVLRALGDSIVMRRVWGGHTPRWMGHDGCEGRVDQVRVDDGEEKLAVQRFTGASGATLGCLLPGWRVL